MMYLKCFVPMLFTALLSFSLLCGSCGKGGGAAPASPDTTKTKENILLADPFILHHDGVYYLYGTSDINADNGIPVYSSTDLVHWQGPAGKAGGGNALSKGQSFGSNGFWAPFVLYRDNRFYMFYTAEEHIAVAVSNSPLGPFTQTDKRPLHPDIKEIDPHVFIDDDGKPYLYFVRFVNGNRVYGAELNDDLLSVKDNTVTECIRQSQDWEIASGAMWPVTEAPSMLKHQGVYYLFYTANDFRNPNYSVGYATSASPLGPWTKYAGNPVLAKNSVMQGTGGCEFTTAPDGSLVMVYHAHYSLQAVTPRKTVWSKCAFIADGILKVDNNRIYPQTEK